MYSRRDFGKIALATLPLSKAFASINSKFDGVQLGVQTYSFRDLPLDEAIKAMVDDGLGDCELFSPHVELGGKKAPMAGMRRPRPNRGRMENSAKTSPGADHMRRMRNDPARAAARAAAREELRKWRLSVPLDYFKDIRQKFNNAGINIYAYNYSFNDSFTNDEIERGFEMAKALGVEIITASTTLPVAKKVVPFAEKHKIMVAMHGHSNLTDPNQFATPESFAKALAMSKYYRVNLDIGHFTAAGFDAVQYIHDNHDRIVLLHLKDRKKNEGPNMPWGEGDTPIKGVLLLLKNKKYPIPGFIEYEYRGTGTSEEEVKKCYDYCKKILNA